MTIPQQMEFERRGQALIAAGDAFDANPSQETYLVYARAQTAYSQMDPKLFNGETDPQQFASKADA